MALQTPDKEKHDYKSAPGGIVKTSGGIMTIDVGIATAVTGTTTTGSRNTTADNVSETTSDVMKMIGTVIATASDVIDMTGVHRPSVGEVYPTNTYVTQTLGNISLTEGGAKKLDSNKIQANSKFSKSKSPLHVST